MKLISKGRLNPIDSCKVFVYFYRIIWAPFENSGRVELSYLKRLGMENQSFNKTEVLVKFMSPGSRLAGVTYDEKGNKIKGINEPFTKEEIADLKSRGIEKLYYVKEKSVESPHVSTQQDVKDKLKETEKNKVAEPEEKQLVNSPSNKEFLSDVVQRARVLMANFNLDERNYFIPRFIANGLAVYRVDHAGDMKAIIERYKITHCFLSVETDGKEWVRILEDIRMLNDQFQVFVYYGQGSKKHLSQLAEHGFVTASFLNSTDKKELAKNVIEAININDPYFSKRSHLKALMAEEDQVKVDIYLSEKQIISGKAYSISPLDLTVALSKDMKGEMYNFSIGDKLPRVGLSVSGNITVTQAEVLNLNFDAFHITLKFTQKSESLLSLIGKIMMEKLKRIQIA